MILERSQIPFVHDEYLKIFQTNFNILDMFSMYTYYSQHDALRDHLASLYKTVYDSRDRIIVFHFDTDYYIQNQVGINLTNFFTAWKHSGIPWHVMLFYTNHIGISQEINALTAKSPLEDRPTVVETSLSSMNYNESIYDIELDLNQDQIQYHAMALLGTPRTHRFALYNHLQSLNEKIVMTLKGKS